MRYGRWLAALAVLAAAAVGLSACSQREASIVDQAFKSDIKSAQMVMRLTVQGRPVFDLEGPFESNGPKQLPSFDWKVKAMGGLAGDVVSSGKNVFVTYKGVTYEVGEDKVAKLFAEQKPKGGEVGSLRELQDRYGIDLQQWFSDTSTKEDANAAGVPTTRVSGKLDIDRAVDDIAKLLKRPEFRSQMKGGSIGAGELDQLKAALQGARFSLDIGREDHKLRQITTNLRIKAGGRAITMGFLLELRDVDKPVSIDAPTSGRPIEELLQKLGGKELQKTA
jgi:hypothetical protein